MLEDHASPLQVPDVSRPDNAAVPDQTVQLMHWWVSGGEVAALDELKARLRRSGVTCDDIAIAGGAGLAQQLDAMFGSGKVPSAVVMSGSGARHWAAKGAFANISALDESGVWNNAVPAALQEFCKHDGHWIGVPVSLHTINWLWINRAAAGRIGMQQPPSSLGELYAALESARNAGLVPLAIGGQPWLWATLFDTLVVATNGLEFYKRAFFSLEKNALNSPGMVEAFRHLVRLASYADPGHLRCSWSDATAKVVTGEALLEVSGDWARAEHRTAENVQNLDYWCVRFPGTANALIFNADIMAMFNVGAERQAAQSLLAKLVMDPGFQTSFNTLKGAAPARLDVLGCSLDADGMLALANVKAANANGTLVGAMSHGFAQPAGVQEAYFSVVKAVFQGDVEPEAAAALLSDALLSAKALATDA